MKAKLNHLLAPILSQIIIIFIIISFFHKAHGYLKEIETTFPMISRLMILNCMEHIFYAVIN